MRKTVFGCLGAAAVALALQFTTANVHAGLFSIGGCNPCDPIACEPCDALACDPCDPCGNGCAPVKAGKWFLNGHMEAGFWANAHGEKSAYGGANRGAILASGNTGLLQNTRLTGAQINQVYLSMGKKVDGRHGLDIGGTIDFTWGSDAYLVQTAGMESATGHWSGMTPTMPKGVMDQTGAWGSGDYFSAFAQAYAELAYGRWNVIIGKFYAPFGSDSYKSTDNFFYTWSPNNLINPQVGGGAYASYKVSDKLTVIGGWVMPEEIGESSNNNALLGGFVWTPSKRFNTRYAFAAGENHYDGNFPGADYDYFTHSLTATTQINKRLKYVFDWSYFHIKAAGTGDNLDAYGLNNEIIYQYNKRWAFGTRFGMIHGEALETLIDPQGQVLNAWGGDWCFVSLGANWTPNKWLVVKPELRYDWMDGGAAPATVFNTGENTYQFSGGMSAVVKF